MPEIAINIVRYNQNLEEICECINAVLAQDHPNFTLTLSENGSKDSIEAALKERFGANPKFKFVDNRAQNRVRFY